MQSIVTRVQSLPRWVLIVIGVAILAIAAIVAGNSTLPAQVQLQSQPETAKAFTGDLTGGISATGQLTPKRDANLSMGGTGIVMEVHAAVGDKVKSGDVLVRLDDTIARENVAKAALGVQMAQVKLESAQHDLQQRVGWSPNQNQLNGAEAVLANAQAAVKAAQFAYDKVAYLPGVSSTPQSLALEQATNNYNKAKADLDFLYSNRPDIVIAQNNVQAAQLALSTAQLDLKTAQDTLDRMTLTAPFDGTVTAVNVEVGEAAVGPVVELVSADDLDVVLDLDEVDIGAVKVDNPATVTFDAWPGVQVSGRVATIAPKANANSSVVNFEVHLSLDKNDLDLRAGMTANVTIETVNIKNVLLVPNSAVYRDAKTGKTYVSLVTLEGAKTVEVTIGARNAEHSQIVSGIKDGDEVLANGTNSTASIQTK